MPDDDDTPSDEQEADDRIPPKSVLHDDKIPSDEQKGDEQITPQY